MQPSSEFDLAQKHLKDRQRNRSLLAMWLILFGLMFAGNALIAGVNDCWIVLEILTGSMALVTAVQLYYGSLNHPIPDDLIAREMEWLFEADWQDTTGAEEYSFAQDRIRKRRLDRWLYGAVSLLLIPVGYVCLASTAALGAICVVPVIVLFVIAIRTCVNLFAPESVLAKRERKVGRALRLELERMQPPEKRKNEEKPKRNIEYTVGDDGELVERDPSDDKPKRDRL